MGYCKCDVKDYYAVLIIFPTTFRAHSATTIIRAAGLRSDKAYRAPCTIPIAP
jgi:hypothetical protein